MAKKDVKTLVEDYRQNTADGDPDLEGEDILAKIVRAKEPAAIELLLTLYPTDADWNGDERNEVISALMDIPKKVFIPEFARLAAGVCRATPELFDELSVRVIAQSLSAFLRALPPMSAGDRDRMITRIDKGHQDCWAGDPNIPSDVLERHEQVIAHLKGIKTI